MRALVLACLALAGASLLLGAVPTYDPWTWIVWGREVVGLDLSTSGATWKPLPVLVTTVASLAGSAAPSLWLVVDRAAGLLALVLAFRLARRLVGPARAPAVRAGVEAAARQPRAASDAGGIVAGTLAVVALVLVRDWVRYLAHGNSEILLVALALWALQAQLDGRRIQAFALGVGASLIRPEAWPFLGLYALWLWRREPNRRVGLAAGLLVVPVLWFGPEWLASGDPLGGAQTAVGSQEAQATAHVRDPALEVLRRGADLVALPVLVAALAAVVLGLARQAGAVLALGLGALAWTALVVGMQALGYPGIARFMVPAAAALCVLAGIGVVWVARLADRTAWGPGALAVALVALALPGLTDAASALPDQLTAAGDRARLFDDLHASVRSFGGPGSVRGRGQPCVNQDLRPALAWLLGLHIAQVCVRGYVAGRATPAGVAFVTPQGPLTGVAPALPPGAGPPALRRGAWRVYVVRPAPLRAGLTARSASAAR